MDVVCSPGPRLSIRLHDGGGTRGTDSCGLRGIFVFRHDSTRARESNIRRAAVDSTRNRARIDSEFLRHGIRSFTDDPCRVGVTDDTVQNLVLV